MQAPVHADSREGLRQASDLLRYAARAKIRMAEARRKISLPPAGYLWVLAAMIIFVLILVVAHQNQPKPVTPEYPSAVPIPGAVLVTEPATRVDAPRANVPEVRRATYVIGAHYNIGTEQAPFNVIFRGTKASIDKLLLVPNPHEGDMYWVPATGHCWFLTRVGGTHRLSWVDP
jgi:hypothetical protein